MTEFEPLSSYVGVLVTPDVAFRETAEGFRQWAGVLTDEGGARLAKTLAVHAELSELLRSRRYSSDWEV